MDRPTPAGRCQWEIAAGELKSFESLHVHTLPLDGAFSPHVSSGAPGDDAMAEVLATIGHRVRRQLARDGTAAGLLRERVDLRQPVGIPRRARIDGTLGQPPMDFDKFLEVLRALAHEGVDYVLVGAVALGIHGLVRATEDVDLFIRPDGENVERLKRALRSVWEPASPLRISPASIRRSATGRPEKDS